MVPLRFIAEALGAKVDWNGDTETATATLGGKVLSVKIGALDMINAPRFAVTVR